MDWLFPYSRVERSVDLSNPHKHEGGKRVPLISGSLFRKSCQDPGQTILHALPHLQKRQTKAPPISPLNDGLIDHERPIQVWDENP
jgi:hypothetical protein